MQSIRLREQPSVFCFAKSTSLEREANTVTTDYSLDFAIISVLALTFVSVFNRLGRAFADARHTVRTLLAPDGFAVCHRDICEGTELLAFTAGDAFFRCVKRLWLNAKRIESGVDDSAFEPADGVDLNPRKPFAPCDCFSGFGAVFAGENRTDNGANLVCLFCSCGAAGTDGPDRLICDDDLAGVLSGDTEQSDLELACNNLSGYVLVAFFEKLTYAENGLQAGIQCGNEALEKPKVFIRTLVCY